jgi:hypothetical protein
MQAVGAMGAIWSDVGGEGDESRLNRYKAPLPGKKNCAGEVLGSGDRYRRERKEKNVLSTITNGIWVIFVKFLLWEVKILYYLYSTSQSFLKQCSPCSIRL